MQMIVWNLFLLRLEKKIGYSLGELDSNITHNLLDKIFVHEKEQWDKQIVMRVKVHYRFIGCIDTIMVKSKLRS